eukprot:jgi/Galph1/5787/GphlegSOOS_G4468.1
MSASNISLVAKTAIAHVLATANNTFVTMTTPRGRIMKTVSGGLVGFKKCRRGTSLAGFTVGYEAGKVAKDRGYSLVEVQLKGFGIGREAAIQGLNRAGLNIVAFYDVTPVPHNGSRPPKARRL